MPYFIIAILQRFGFALAPITYKKEQQTHAGHKESDHHAMCDNGLQRSDYLNKRTDSNF